MPEVDILYRILPENDHLFQNSLQVMPDIKAGIPAMVDKAEEYANAKEDFCSKTIKYGKINIQSTTRAYLSEKITRPDLPGSIDVYILILFSLIRDVCR